MTDQPATVKTDDITPTHATPWVGDRRGVIGKLDGRMYACVEVRIPLGEVGGKVLHIHATLPLGVVQLWADDEVVKSSLDPAEVDRLSDTMCQALHATLLAMEEQAGLGDIGRMVKGLEKLVSDAEVGKSDAG